MTQPTRAYDALYDPTFTVAGPRDHYRQQTLGGGFNIERAPVYNNFFSELPHYPPSTLRLKNLDRLPAFVDRNFHPQPHDPSDIQERSDALAVSGPHRPKYFRRPLLAAAEIHVKQSPGPLPPLPQYQDLNATAPAIMSEPRSKTIGTQSDYRENEAQTAPWEPGYVIPEHPTAKQQALSRRHHTEGPEVLQLRDMTFGDGLPAGLQEVTRIDKMRAKRAFEATLPPIDDVARLPLRQKMIEEWESREWAEREEEILEVQEQRLALLDNALQVREEELEEEHRQRVEERKQATLEAKAGIFADVQATRIKTMRQLIENRKYVEKHRKLHRPPIVERYANFGSGTYAPLQREGRFPESKPLGQEIETEGYEPSTLKGVVDLENFLPARLLNPRMEAPKRPTRLNYTQRKEAAIQRDLKSINDLLDTSKLTAGRGYGDCWPAPLKDDAGGGGGGASSGAAGGGAGAAGPPIARTPSMPGTTKSVGGLSSYGGAAAAAGGGAGGAAAAAAASGAGASAATSSGGGMLGGASPARRVVRAVERPPTPELPQPATLQQPQHAAVVLLQRLLRGRAAQNIMYEGRMRRQELIDELRLADGLSADGRRLYGKLIRRPEDRDAATIRVDALMGSAVSELCAILSETDPDKREVMLAALGISRTHTAAVAAVAAAAASITAAVQGGASGADAASVAAESGDSGGGEAAAAAAARPAAAVIDLTSLGITVDQAEEAVVRIQAACRGHRARKEVAAMRERGEALRRLMAEVDEEKVVTCQAAIRGYLDRKKVRELREERQRAVEGGAAEEEEEEEEEGAGAAAAAGEEGSAEEQAPQEFDPSSYTEEQVAAVTRIQAAQRGALARKQVAAMRQQLQQPALDDDAAAAAEVRSDYTVEQQVAVIRIQAAGRGFLARQQVRALREGREQERLQALMQQQLALQSSAEG
ncbi:hypothetical protein Agub_g14325, partial [Astrephomene gubernaculifera]